MKKTLYALVFTLVVINADAQLTRLHVKSPIGSTWGISSEAPANKKLLGFTHDGSSGIISTGTSDGTTQYSPLKFATGGLPRMTILENGFIGIGTSSPTVELTVAGKILAKEVKVNIAAGTGPDYVFLEKYNLNPLSFVAKYIKLNNHLPEVPSAKVMESEGVSVGEMNMILLKKVEELTLYLIEQDKQVQLLKDKVNKLEKEAEKK